MTKTRRKSVFVGIGIAAVAAAGAPQAMAGTLATQSTACGSEPLVQPFVPWLDTADYVMAPNGGLESGSTGWTLTGKAAVVRGNESFSVNNKKDSYSLSLPAGSSATTRAQCITLSFPTMRFFARNTGDVTSYLKVEALYEDTAGTVKSIAIGSVKTGSAWAPTSAIAIIANLSATWQSGQAPVAFRFTPQGTGGKWQIDDIYVDPFRMR